MVLLIIVYEETVSVSEVMNISDYVTKKNITQYYNINRTLMKKLIMYLPNWLFKPPTRIVIVKSTMPELKLSKDDQLSISECKEMDTFSDVENDIIMDNSNRYTFISKPPDVVIHNTSFSSFSESSEYKIKQLDQQLTDIRAEIKEIYFILSSKNNSNLDFDFPNEDKPGKENVYSPPPAPPLPPATTEILKYKTPNKTSYNIKVQDTSPKITMADVLKEMNKVKLKPVQRTPGGRPSRNLSSNLPKSDNLSPDLQAILKRRYSAMHNISPMSPDTTMLRRSNSQDSFYDNF